MCAIQRWSRHVERCDDSTLRDQKPRLMSKIVVLTGGATGIGAATVTRLLAADCQVYVLDVKAPTHRGVRFTHCDSVAAGCDRAAVVALPRTIDALVNVAGIPGPEPAETVMAVNFLALRHLTESLVDRVTDGGSIVNVASSAGRDWQKREDVIQEAARHAGLCRRCRVARGRTRRPGARTPTSFRNSVPPRIRIAPRVGHCARRARQLCQSRRNRNTTDTGVSRTRRTGHVRLGRCTDRPARYPGRYCGSHRISRGRPVPLAERRRNRRRRRLHRRRRRRLGRSRRVAERENAPSRTTMATRHRTCSDRTIEVPRVRTRTSPRPSCVLANNCPIRSLTVSSRCGFTCGVLRFDGPKRFSKRRPRTTAERFRQAAREAERGIAHHRLPRINGVELAPERAGTLPRVPRTNRKG